MGGSMNRSKLYEWLLDNDCPFEWQTDESSSYIDDPNECPIVFTDKEAA